MQSTPGVSVTIGGNHTAAVVRSWWSIIPQLNGSLLSSLAQAGRQGGMSVGQGGSSPSSQPVRLKRLIIKPIIATFSSWTCRSRLQVVHQWTATPLKRGRGAALQAAAELPLTQAQ